MANRLNILFITFDDLRPELGCYGKPFMHTPHIDRLAASSVQFNHAYCQVPVCGASRASLFSGLQPTPQRFVSFLTRLEDDAPEAIPLHTHLRNHGYVTFAHGKVLHHADDCAAGWTKPPVDREEWFPGYANAENVARIHERNRAIAAGEKPGKRGPAWEIGDDNVDEYTYADGQILRSALADMQQLAAQDQPFFMAVGFRRPHLPFVAPRKYWELYDPDQVALSTIPAPRDCPPQALHNSGELRFNYTGIPESGPFDQQTQRWLIHGYRASVSYVDEMVGRLIEGLERHGLADRTIVVFAPDHGFNLGEHGLWCKHCLFETSLRVPMLIRVPGMTSGWSDGLADLLDIYPTLCDLLDLPAPHPLAGQSLLPRLADPAAPGKAASLSRYGNGETVRTEQFRYSQFRNDDGSVAAHMLYDLQADPDETVNLADQPAYRQTVEKLAGLLPPPQPGQT